MSVEPTKRDTISVRDKYAHFVAAGLLTTMWRPGERTVEKKHSKAYFSSQNVCVRIIDKVGSDELGIEPTFMPGLDAPAVILTIEPKRCGELVDEDFEGSPDVRNREGLKAQFTENYDKATGELCDNDNSLVTRVTIKYVPEYTPNISVPWQ